MNFQTYKELTKRTLPDLGSQVLNSVHMCLGFASETYELVEAFQNKDMVNVGEEIADKFWYVANYMNINQLELAWEFLDYSVNVDSTIDGSDFFVYESMLLDYDKKWLAYGKERDMQLISSVVNHLLLAYNNLCHHHKINPSDIMEKNINKLKVRFPEKFTTEDAINRDLDSEREVLEGK